MSAKIVKFPDQHYIGFRPEFLNYSKDQFSHYTGFLSPYGTDAQAKKRMATVDSWAWDGSRYYNYVDGRAKELVTSPFAKASEVVDNKPMAGFVIDHRLNRGGSWHGNQDKWKIDDPRGFQLEISGTNLERIIEYCKIDHGAILGECIWGREGAENVLVPVDSDLYQTALKNTVIAKKTFSLKDLLPGDTVLMQDTTSAMFAGKYYTVDFIYDTAQVVKYEISKKPKYIFKTSDGNYKSIATPKISSVESHGVAPTEAEINSAVTTADAYGQNNCIWGHTTTSVAVTADPNMVITHEFIYLGNLYDAKTKKYKKVFNQKSDEVWATTTLRLYNKEPSVDGYGTFACNPKTLGYYYTTTGGYYGGKYKEKITSFNEANVFGLDMILTSETAVYRVKQ